MCVNFFCTAEWLSYTYIHTYILCHILFHCGLSQDIECSSLCCMVGPCCLSILYIVVWRRRWHPTPVLLSGKSHGWRSLVGYSPWGREESDTTERLPFHFSLSCIGEGIGNPLQCSCLENPRDGEPGGLTSMGSHRVGHDWNDLAAAAAAVFFFFFFLQQFYSRFCHHCL